MSGAVLDLDAQRKAWDTLRARFALAGYALHRLAGGGFSVAKGNVPIDIPDVTNLMAFAERAGIDTGLTAE